MHDQLEYTDKLPCDQQRAIERRLRRRARTVTLVLLVLALLGVWDMRIGDYAARAHAATVTNEALNLATVPVAAAPTPEQSGFYESATHGAGEYGVILHTVPNTLCGTDGATDTTGTLIVAP